MHKTWEEEKIELYATAWTHKMKTKQTSKRKAIVSNNGFESGRDIHGKRWDKQNRIPLALTLESTILRHQSTRRKSSFTVHMYIL